MLNKIPWITPVQASKYKLDLPINAKEIVRFLELEQNSDGFYNTLEETFWAVIALLKLNAFPEKNKKNLISFILKHRVSSGGYSNRINGTISDIYSTFYAIALLELMGVFKSRLIDDQLFCPECGQKLLFKDEICFDCGTNLKSEKIPCAICNKVIQHSPPEAAQWETLCNTCHDNILDDIVFILGLQKKKGILHCESEKCIDCQGRPSYKAAFFAINTLIILNSSEKLDEKSLLNFLKRDHYIQENERIFQLLSYSLLNEERNIDFLAHLEDILQFHFKNSGFGLGKKVPVVSDTFWSVIAFNLRNAFHLIQIGGIYNFLLGLKRNDGGYSEQIMDTISNIQSTVQSLLIIFMIFDPLIEEIEGSILKKSISEYKIFLKPIADQYSVSSDFVESVAYHLLSKEWFQGKVLDQLDFFNEHLNQGNKIIFDIGKSLIQMVQNQKITELNLSEFSKRFDFDNAEERVKTTILDFTSRKLIEGTVQEIKKTFKKFFLFSDINLPRKFIALSLDRPIQVDRVFEEKLQSLLKKKEIEEEFHSLLELPEAFEQEIQNWLDKKEIIQARERLKNGKTEVLTQIDQFEKKLKDIITEFRYIDFKDLIQNFLDEWPLNKKALIAFMDVLTKRIADLIDNKEKELAHQDTLTKEQRFISNFEEYITQITHKVELLTHTFTKEFQQSYTDHQLASTKISELNQNIDAFSQDISDKFTQFNGSIEISQIPDNINESKTLLDSKIESVKEISNESFDIIAIREILPQKIQEKLKNFKDQQANSQSSIQTYIERKEFEPASKALEAQDEQIKNFITSTTQDLEKDIGDSVTKISHFDISFAEFRTLLSQKLKQLESEWHSQKDELLTRFHEKTELSKKIELNKKMKQFIEVQTENLDSLKKHIELLLKHENLDEAKSKIEANINQFNHLSNKFQVELNDFIKDVTKQYKNFKKLVNADIIDWETEKNFILQSMQTLKNQIDELSVEKDLLNQKNKLLLIIKNQKLVLTKSFSKIIQLYTNSLENGKILEQEQSLFNEISNVYNLIKKTNSQIDAFIKENSKKFSDFMDLSTDDLELWTKTTIITESVLKKIESNISENMLIERIYFVIKAFEGYRTDLKYLSKAVNIKTSQLKDKLVSLLSNSRLEGTLDPINDILTLSALKPIGDVTSTFLRQIEGEIGKVLQIDFVKKEKIPKEIEDKKQYLLQLRYLLVIHRQVGSALYHRKLGTWEIDPDLISGFLSAIGSFGAEIKSKSVPIQKMAYKEFEILLNQGDQIVAALILDGNSSSWHEKKLADFTKEFEKEFEANLKIWSGELTQFKSAGLMVDRVFELFRAYI